MVLKGRKERNPPPLLPIHIGVDEQRCKWVVEKMRANLFVSLCYYSSTTLGKNSSVLQKANQEFAQSWQPGEADRRLLCQAPLASGQTSENLARKKVRQKVRP